jgi:hypothetical protein
MDLEVSYLQKHALDGCSQARPFSELCRLDLSRLRHPWPSIEILNAIRCSFAILMYSVENPDKLPPLTFRIWDTITPITKDRRIYQASVNGIPMLLKLEESARLETDRTLHEVFVGYQLNKVKSEIPFFAYLFGGFGCSIPLTLTDWKNRMEKREAWNLVRMILEVLREMFNRTGLVHQDLHFGNILVRRLDTYYTFVVGGQPFVSKYLPSIIDFARSQIRVDGKIFSPKDEFLQLPAGPMYDVAALLYSWVLFSGDLQEEIPDLTVDDGRSYLKVYDKFAPADYRRVLDLLNAKYPPIEEPGPLFREDRASVQYDENKPSCPESPPVASQKALTSRMGEIAQKIYDQDVEQAQLLIEYYNAAAAANDRDFDSVIGSTYHYLSLVLLPTTDIAKRLQEAYRRAHS